MFSVSVGIIHNRYRPGSGHAGNRLCHHPDQTVVVLPDSYQYLRPKLKRIRDFLHALANYHDRLSPGLHIDYAVLNFPHERQGHAANTTPALLFFPFETH